MESTTQPLPSKGAIYGSLVGSVFGPTIWLVIVSIIARNWFMAALVTAASVAIYIFSARACVAAPRDYFKITGKVLFAVIAVNLVTVNLVWESFLVRYREMSIYQSSSDWSLMKVNTVIIVLFVVIWIMMNRTKRRVERALADQEQEDK